MIIVSLSTCVFTSLLGINLAVFVFIMLLYTGGYTVYISLGVYIFIFSYILRNLLSEGRGLLWQGAIISTSGSWECRRIAINGKIVFDTKEILAVSWDRH